MYRNKSFLYKMIYIEYNKAKNSKKTVVVGINCQKLLHHNFTFIWYIPNSKIYIRHFIFLLRNILIIRIKKLCKQPKSIIYFLRSCSLGRDCQNIIYHVSTCSPVNSAFRFVVTNPTGHKSLLEWHSANCAPTLPCKRMCVMQEAVSRFHYRHANE